MCCSSSLVIKTVLKSGGEYGPEHVTRLAAQLRQHISIPYKFVCYSDLDFPLDGEIRPLLHNWPGWWSKLEIFREVETSFYFDLDMTIQGDITAIVERQYTFAALNNLTPPIRGIGSAMMGWAGDWRNLYEVFKADPQYYMARNSFKSTSRWGDQGFIYSQVADIERLQITFPGLIRKYSDKDDSAIRVFFGPVKPWGVQA